MEGMSDKRLKGRTEAKAGRPYHFSSVTNGVDKKREEEFFFSQRSSYSAAIKDKPGNC